MKKYILSQIADEEIYCPHCGVCIEYDYQTKPGYCPCCGTRLDMEVEEEVLPSTNPKS